MRERDGCNCRGRMRALAGQTIHRSSAICRSFEKAGCNSEKCDPMIHSPYCSPQNQAMGEVHSSHVVRSREAFHPEEKSRLLGRSLARYHPAANNSGFRLSASNWGLPDVASNSGFRRVASRKARCVPCWKTDAAHCFARQFAVQNSSCHCSTRHSCRRFRTCRDLRNSRPHLVGVEPTACRHSALAVSSSVTSVVRCRPRLAFAAGYSAASAVRYCWRSASAGNC